jgi:hypothetical protein
MAVANLTLAEAVALQLWSENRSLTASTFEARRQGIKGSHAAISGYALKKFFGVNELDIETGNCLILRMSSSFALVQRVAFEGPWRMDLETGFSFSYLSYESEKIWHWMPGVESQLVWDASWPVRDVFSSVQALAECLEKAVEDSCAKHLP